MAVSQCSDLNESLCSSPDQYQDEELDPRVKVELDRLNRATDEINKLESALEDANNSFRHDLSHSSSGLQLLGRKLATAVEKSRPYYETMQHARKLHLDCQRTAVQYHRANAVHQAARSTISLAEERFTNPNHDNQRQFDPAWQEMLNHATIKVLEAEARRSASEREHEARAAAFSAAQQRVTVLSRELKSAISKARPYFEQKDLFDAQMEQMSQRVEQLQRAVAGAKLSYAHALRSLEQISEEIHAQRRCGMTREPGVGAEDVPETENSCYSSDWSSSSPTDCAAKVQEVTTNTTYAALCSAPSGPVTCPGSVPAVVGTRQVLADDTTRGGSADEETRSDQHTTEADTCAAAFNSNSTKQSREHIMCQAAYKSNKNTGDTMSTKGYNINCTKQSSAATTTCLPACSDSSSNIDTALVNVAQDIDSIDKAAQIMAASLTISDESLYQTNPSGCDKSLSYVRDTGLDQVV